MPTVADAVKLLEQIAPPELGEEWDNVGLLVGDPAAELTRGLTCLTLTPDVVAEAVESKAELVVTHHPLPFHGIKRLTTESTEGDSLGRLLRAGVAVYSAHTAYDSAAGGINQQWADRLGLRDVTPLQPAIGREDCAGVGRVGTLETDDFDRLTREVSGVCGASDLRVVPPTASPATRIAIACGSGGSLLDLALDARCDIFLTGEMTFHDCLRCRSLGVGVILTGHYASERFAMETLAERLAAGLPGVRVTPSANECDPLVSVA